MKTSTLLAFPLIFLVFASGLCYPPAIPIKSDINKLELPEGFRIAIYAENVDNARSLAKAHDGLIFVSTRKSGKLHALIDEDNDFIVDRHIEIAKDLDTPNGITFHNGDLYVALLNKIVVYRDIENRLNDDHLNFEIIYDNLPTERHHGWKYMNIGPDEKLYFGVGAPCNQCLSEEEIFSTICRVNTDGSGFEIFAHGVRNTIGFDWHPETKEMWFTDNGRDRMGDNKPGDELNRAPKKGMHFGYPFCHQGDIVDPEFKDHHCDDYTPPEQVMGPHVATLGMRFYTGVQFPDSLQGDIFIAEHGSWNRTTPIGYRITRVKMDGGKAIAWEPFITGWLQGAAAWGRPVDLLMLDDGSMLISDDHANMVYRLWYEG